MIDQATIDRILDAAQCFQVKHILEQIIDPKQDSLRFYYLGNNYKTKVEHIGAKPTYEAEGVLMV